MKIKKGGSNWFVTVTAENLQEESFIASVLDNMIPTKDGFYKVGELDKYGLDFVYDIDPAYDKRIYNAVYNLFNVYIKNHKSEV